MDVDVDVDVDVATLMEASITDVLGIGEAEDAGARAMWGYTMTMEISLLIP
jgi:hypothetical protein